MGIVIKTASEPKSIISAVRQQILSIDPDQPIYDIHTLSEMRTGSIAPQRLVLILLSIFGGDRIGFGWDWTLWSIGLYRNSTPAGNRHSVSAGSQQAKRIAACDRTRDEIRGSGLCYRWNCGNGAYASDPFHAI